MKKLWVQMVVILVLTGLFTYSVDYVLKNLWIYRISFPEQAAMEDFLFEDFVFSGKDPGKVRDEYVTLVNVGQLGRSEIAELVEIIQRHDPGVLVVDVIFNSAHPNNYDSIGTLRLKSAFDQCRTLVAASKLHDKSGSAIGRYDSVEWSSTLLLDTAISGYTNLGTGDTTAHEIKAVRSFIPNAIVDGKRQLALSVETCLRYLEDKVAGGSDAKRYAGMKKTLDRLMTSGSTPQIINYRGNVAVKGAGIKVSGSHDYFTTYDVNEVLSGNFNPADITGKVVLMGYMGDYLADGNVEDLFLSPMNDPLDAKLPDMYGVVVHANIISMILHGDLITEMSEFTTDLISLLILLANVLLFIRIESKPSAWREVWVLLIPASQIILLAMLEYFVFSQFSYILRLPITTALVSVSLATALYFGPIQHLVNKKTRGGHEL